MDMLINLALANHICAYSRQTSQVRLSRCFRERK